ncbi:hypothetical protein [Panacagrimonas sp.]|uniref:hypothetical protein n=1 Tax=Panacagrimonas sp. TaxID=2480088 RepID=UPI003B52CF87
MAIIQVPNGNGGQSNYQDDPNAVGLQMGDVNNLHDFTAAEPGQWFYGVAETTSGKVYWVPGDVHDDPNNAQQLNARMINTYASKPAVPATGWKSPNTPHEKANGIDSNPTGHQSVVRLYALDGGASVGFRIIKINAVLVSFSDRSNSLNGNKPDARGVAVHPYGTPPNSLPQIPGVTHVIKNAAGYGPSPTSRLPDKWSTAIQAYLTGSLGLQKIAVDF